MNQMCINCRIYINKIDFPISCIIYGSAEVLQFLTESGIEKAAQQKSTRYVAAEVEESNGVGLDHEIKKDIGISLKPV